MTSSLVSGSPFGIAKIALTYAAARLALLIQLKVINDDLSTKELLLWALLDSFFTFLILISDLGLRGEAMRQLAKIENEYERISAANGYFFAIAFASTLVVSLGCIALFLYNPDIPASLILGYAGANIVFVLGSIEWYWMANGRPGRVAAQRAVSEFIALLIVFLAIKKYGLLAAPIGSLAGALTVLALNARSVKQICSIGGLCDRISPWKAMPLFIATLLGQAWLRMPTWLLTATGYPNIGLFWAAFRVLIIFMEAVSVVNQYYYRSLAISVRDKSLEPNIALRKYSKGYLQATIIMALVTIFIAILTISLSMFFDKTQSIFKEYSYLFLLISALLPGVAMWIWTSPQWNYLLLQGRDTLLSLVFIAGMLPLCLIVALPSEILDRGTAAAIMFSISCFLIGLLTIALVNRKPLRG